MSGFILRAANDFTVVFLGTSRSDDSTGDRLSYRYTCAILIAFTLIVSNREFTMKRIQCWVPAFFTENYEEYTNNVCWVRNTYYLNDNSDVPETPHARQETSIRYYQWIPFILLFQAFFFFLPYVLWRVLCQRSGIDIRDVVEAAANYKKSTDEKQREQLMNFMVSIIDQYVDDPRRQSDNRETVWWKKCFLMFFPSSGRYMGDYLRNLFIFIKIIYVANIFGQVLLLSFLLGQPFWSLGFTVLRFIYEGRGWDYQSRYFPKVTLCDFQIREANSMPIAHTYTVMCVLPINLFNQQIFTFLWFWLVIVIILTIYDLCIWIYRLFFRREVYLESRLKVIDWEIAQKWPYKDACIDHINAAENEHLMTVQNRNESELTDDHVRVLNDGRKIHQQSRMFIVPRSYYKHKRSIFQFFNYEYLEADGHFILRIIGTNASDFVATKIIHKSYVICCERRFRAFEVQKCERTSRATLYKYLIIPKEEQLNERNQSSSGSATNLFPPLPLPRSSSINADDNLSPSDIGPAVLDPGREQHLSKRSQSKPDEIQEK
ncbi:unnamed protein product [Adineta ricciae]|uniref:Innexin n=1 Tax=Adineta ricciae TaxID=249248 RepID=A0A813RF00_ADIRI|nr:unnamed protein product [Adineta ricciae]CAF0840656.1 unnamed protein product [Adineta ricciae]